MKNISDLLDTYMDESVELSGDTPLSSARIKELTMNKIAENRPVRHKNVGSRRILHRLLVAAVVTTLLSISALAAGYILGAGALFQDFFGNDEAPLTSAQIETLDEIGQTIEDSMTSNGATITPIAVIGDEHCCYLRMRIEATVGVTLPDLDQNDGFYHLSGDQSGERMTLDLKEGAYRYVDYNAGIEWLPDSDPTDNMKEAVIHWETTSGSDLKFNDGISKILTIHGLWIERLDKEYTQVFSGEFIFDIGMDCESQTVTLDCGGAAHEDTIYGITNYLDSVTISPLSVSFEFRTNLLPNEWIGASLGYFEVVLKDGTKMFQERNNVEWRYVGMHPQFDPDTMIGDTPNQNKVDWALFDTPVDLAQVDYFQFEDFIFPVTVE